VNAAITSARFGCLGDGAAARSSRDTLWKSLRKYWQAGWRGARIKRDVRI
jgi:hypothetical protein